MEILKGKVAVVTGAASEIGRAIATAFVDAGANVLLCDVNYRAVEAVARELGDRAIGRVTDVSDQGQVEGALRAAREAFGSLDIVVNCAGLGAAVFLASDHAKSINDETIAIDGGSLTKVCPALLTGVRRAS